MDRSIIYPGQIPLETDQLNQNRATMLALGKLVSAALGTGNVVSGLTVAPNTPAALNVVVSPGEIYSLQNIDGTAYSSLPADTTHTCMKQGISLDATTIGCAAPSTAGFSINYLIEATFQEVDGANVVLPYYNASNPTQAYSGPANSGAAQATLRQGKVVLQAKAGIAATAGTQVTPVADAGYVALAVVTVANGQTTIVAGNIVAVASTAVLTNSLLGMINGNSPGRLLNIQVIGATAPYVPTPGTKNCYARVQGGGAGGGGCPPTSAGNTSAGVGGGAGAYAEGYYPVATLAGLTVTIGAGGTAAPGAAGGNGGASSIGTVIIAPGGAGGGAGTNNSPPWASGSGNVSAIATGGNIINACGLSGDGAFSIVVGSPISGKGGGSPFGSGGASRSTTSSAGQPGTGPGAGGSGGVLPSGIGSSAGGGTGIAGIVVIEEYA